MLLCTLCRAPTNTGLCPYVMVLRTPGYGATHTEVRCYGKVLRTLRYGPTNTGTSGRRKLFMD
eukprot:3937672-Rhodomonas_salina.1